MAVPNSKIFIGTPATGARSVLPSLGDEKKVISLSRIRFTASGKVR